MVVEGLGSFPTQCFTAACGALQACELVTGEACAWDPYDVLGKNVGSYVPASFSATPAEFAFGVYLMKNDIGNISSCRAPAAAKALLAAYGLATIHTYCGLGNWHFN